MGSIDRTCIAWPPGGTKGTSDTFPEAEPHFREVAPKGTWGCAIEVLTEAGKAPGLEEGF